MDASKLTEVEISEIRFYYDRLKAKNANVSAYLPYIMKMMGQYVSLSEEKEISDRAKKLTDNIDFETTLSLITEYWKDSNLSIEKAIRDLDQFNTGLLKLDYFYKVMSEYGEPLEANDLNELVKFLFKKKTEISCNDAISTILSIKLEKKKKKKKKRKPFKKLNAYQEYLKKKAATSK